MKLPAQVTALAEIFRKSAWMRSMAARLLHMQRSTLYALMALLLFFGFVLNVREIPLQVQREQESATQAEQRLVFSAKTGVLKHEGQEAFDVEEESPEERKLRRIKKKGGEQPSQAPSTAIDEAKEPAPAAEPGEAAIDASAANTDTDKADVATGATKVAVPLKEEVAPLVTHPKGAIVLEEKINTDFAYITRNESSLVFAPAPEITGKSKWGPIPQIATNGTRAADLYARSYRQEEGKTMLAIVFTGLGFSARSLQLAASLPPEVTVSFSPYASGLNEKIESFRNAGHEVWLDLPTQTARYPHEDPGPLGMIASLSNQTLSQHLEQIVAKAMGAVGVIFPADQTLSDFAPSFQNVLNGIGRYGLHAFFADGKLPRITSKIKTKMRASSKWVARETTPSMMMSQLKTLSEALQAADINKPVILTLEGSVHHLQLVQEWIEKDLKNLPVSLAPLSAFYLDFEALAAEEAKALEEAEKAKKGHGGGH